jgi:hypothetical protein
LLSFWSNLLPSSGSKSKNSKEIYVWESRKSSDVNANTSTTAMFTGTQMQE